jgi:hypothetical protein
MSAAARAQSTPRWGHPVTVVEVVYLSQHGVAPEKIVAKIQRSGIVYLLSEEQLKSIRAKGVTPVVIDYMRQTLVEAEEQYPKLKDDKDLSCFYLGPDGFWYGGGPWGFHPDC